MQPHAITPLHVFMVNKNMIELKAVRVYYCTAAAAVCLLYYCWLGLVNSPGLLQTLGERRTLTPPTLDHTRPITFAIN